MPSIDFHLNTRCVLRFSRVCLAVWLLAISYRVAAHDALLPLLITRSDDVTVLYTVELAASPAARTQGLMGRKTLRPQHGMLFDFGEEVDAKMWMKNTHIPLDMLFVDRCGNVVSITARTTPLSTTLIGAKRPVRYVLELNAGSTELRAIQAGDKLSYLGEPASGRAFLRQAGCPGT